MNVQIVRAIDGVRTVIRIAGRLRSVDLAELEKELRLVDGAFVLDLSELVTADEAGIERLRELASGPAELQGTSRYMQLLLAEE